MFRDRIKSAYSELSPSFQKLGDYLMDHPYEAAFMTATQLGRQLEVDTATVVRFAQRLDYPGFPELLDEIRQEVKSQLVRYFQPSEAEPNDRDMFHAAIRQDMHNIEQFDLTLEQETVVRLLSMVNAARHILVVGDGMLSKPLAQLLANAISMLGYNAARLDTDAGTVATVFQSLTSQDLVMAVAATNYCPDATSIMELAHERGAATIALVGAQSWPIARAVDLTILCPSTGATRGATATVFCTAISALNQTLFSSRRAETLEKYVEFESAMHSLSDARGRFEFSKPDWAVDNSQPD